MATHSHKRETARRKPRAALIAAPIAVLATGAAVTAGVLGSEPPSDLLAVDQSAAGDIADRSPVISRGDGSRGDPSRPAGPSARDLEAAAAPQLSPADEAMLPKAVAAAVRNADTQLWTTTELNIWTRPDKQARQLGVLDAVKKVSVTGREMLGRQEIVLDGEARWVTSGYLSEEKPDLGPTLGGECTNGTSVPSSVSPNIQAIHEAVCANFPEITTYGTLRSDGEHAQGIAMDIMVAGDRAWQVAEFLREYYSEFGVNYVIHAQRIWSVQRSSEGWRPMEDRGSVTANHYDHVHVTTY
ncbi:hypothetical protein [Nocardioides sp. TF02-7]|uniref:hypothetical protein n=1 Tax=Nocardioides sp. TF02-7 TaxID=2917724 RepID=UPI001F05A773|nr:hypothetical protein [Nocardioides sp. TF02-7]UMG92259.1 hypothetical protein MF408_20495 [Nocardioides sp. TF02-7]